MLNRLKRLFSPTVESDSNVRMLLRQYGAQLPPKASRNDHQKCIAVLTHVLNFGLESGKPLPELAKYTTDTCIFELACYILASTDFWTFNKAPDKRQKIQQILFAQLDAICSRSGFLPAEAAFELANNRVGVYGRIAATSLGLEGQHVRLNQALQHASSHSEPSARIDEVSPIFGDPFESLTVTKALVKWDMQRLPDMDAILCTIS